MHTAATAAVEAFLALFPILNPFGGLAVFFGLTTECTREQRAKDAARIALYVVAILLVFALFGTYVLQFFGITLPVLKIAGGLVVAHTAWSMLTAHASRLTPAEKADAEDNDDITFTPMAMPVLAGPGSIAVVMGLADSATGIESYLGVGLAILAMGIVVYLFLRAGEPLVEHLGPAGLGVINRILGFLILAIAVELIVHGLGGLYPALRV